MVDLLKLLDRMGRERHLQLNFDSPALQAVAVTYGLDGGIEAPAEGDFLLLADTSVNSTKLNLILENVAEVSLRLSADGAMKRVSYAISNPFPEWQQGRDPRLVSALMHEGVYGSYLRVYAPKAAQFVDLRLDGLADGPEQARVELGLRAFGRFFPVLPGETSELEMLYYTPGVVQESRGAYTYRLYIQKQAGTRALPLILRAELPAGAVINAMRLDGKEVGPGRLIRTDLSVDRVFEVVWSE